MKAKRQMKPRDGGRRMKKKTSILITEKIDYVDWKDVNLMRRFISDRAKIRARRVTGNDQQQQRQIAAAVKLAREMALIPYTSRVTTQRGGRGRDGDDRRPRRDDGEHGDEFEPTDGDELDVEGADDSDTEENFEEVTA
jgi:small subunit ribosomal protein S18